MFGVLAAIAEFEREMTRERIVAGLQAAKARSKLLGRPLKLPPERIDMAANPLASGRQWREVATALKVSRTTLRAAMQRRRRSCKPAPHEA